MKSGIKILLFLIFASVSMVFAEDTVSIDQAIDMAMKNSPAMHVARENVLQSKGNIDLALSAINPIVSGSADYYRRGPKSEVAGTVVSPSETSQAGIAAQMPIDISGLYGLAIKGSKVMFSASEYDLLSDVFDMIESVKVSYLNVLLCKENIETGESALKLSEEYLAKVKNEVEAGTKAKFDVTRQEYDVAQRKNSLISAKSSYEEAVNNFNMLLGNESNFVVPAPIEDINSISKKIDTNLDLVNIALSLRTDLKKAEKDLEVAKLYLIAAKKQNNPSLNLVGTYNHLLANQMKQKRDTWSAGLNLSVPIFDGGNQAATVKIKETAVNQSQAAVNSVREKVVNGVLNAKLNILSAGSQIETCNSALKLSQEAYEIAKLRYESNLGTYLDVQDALNSLISAKNALFSAEYSYAMSMCALEREICATDNVVEHAQKLFEENNKKSKRPIIISQGEK